MFLKGILKYKGVEQWLIFFSKEEKKCGKVLIIVESWCWIYGLQCPIYLFIFFCNNFFKRSLLFICPVLLKEKGLNQILERERPQVTPLYYTFKPNTCINPAQSKYCICISLSSSWLLLLSSHHFFSSSGLLADRNLRIFHVGLGLPTPLHSSSFLLFTWQPVLPAPPALFPQFLVYTVLCMCSSFFDLDTEGFSQFWWQSTVIYKWLLGS